MVKYCTSSTTRGRYDVVDGIDVTDGEAASGPSSVQTRGAAPARSR